jgi:hypothetical protein
MYPPPVFPPAAPPTPGRSPKVPVVVVALIVVLVLIVGAFLWSRTRTSSFTAKGTMQVFSTSVQQLGDGACAGSDGYSDIGPGAQVVISDPSGKTLAYADLGDGSSQQLTCTFSFTVPKVPSGKQSYGVTISHRGTLHYTEAELKAGVALTIGDGS